MTFYIDANKTGAAREISSLLKNCILHHRKSWKELVFLCIGTDRLTGDCLGPYVGQQLLCNASEKVHVYGTLSHPVHALNLTSASQDICFSHPEALVIAIDASLGQKKHLGYVPSETARFTRVLRFRKSCPPVGDIHVTGIVNTAGLLEQITLQTTRLSTVIHLADKITQGILAMIPSAMHESYFIQKL